MARFRPVTTSPMAGCSWRWPRWRWHRASAHRSNTAGDGIEDVGWLFGEDQGRYLLAALPEKLESILDAARNAGVAARVIGKTGGQSLTLNGCDAICLNELAQRHEGWLPGYMSEE